MTTPANQPQADTNPVPSTPSLLLPPIKRYRTVDLCAGAGGLSTGLEEAGFEVVCAAEYDKMAAATYRLNHPATIVIEGDITLPKTKEAIVAACGDSPIDALVGGCPCQSFSIASSSRAGIQDPRGQVFFAYMHILQILKPKLAVAENVPNLLNYPDAMQSILSIFNHLGYYAEYRVLNAADHGTPQERKRLFFVATKIDFRNASILWPQPQFAPAAKKAVEQ